MVGLGNVHWGYDLDLGTHGHRRPIVGFGRKQKRWVSIPGLPGLIIYQGNPSSALD